MNTQTVTQVANFLGVSPNQIKRCEEWAFVLFVQVQGDRPRFVSKKVVQMVSEIDEYEGIDDWEDEEGDNFEQRVREAIGEIAAWLPVGACPSNANLMDKAYRVAEGGLTAKDAANLLSNKKIIIKRSK